FRLDAEKAHRVTMSLLRTASRTPGGNSMLRSLYTLEDDQLVTLTMGIRVRNPVGLAAGFDKDGKYLDLLPLLGLGVAEVRTVTPRRQPGDSRPRSFRLAADEALINRMGFNNEGVDALARRREQRKDKSIVIGGNIGENK